MLLLLLLFGPLGGRERLLRERVNGLQFSGERTIHEPVALQQTLALELAGHDNGVELATATVRLVDHFLHRWFVWWERARQKPVNNDAIRIFYSQMPL